MALTLPTPDQTVEPETQNTGGRADPGAYGAVGAAIEQGGSEFARNADWWANKEAMRQQQNNLMTATSKAAADFRLQQTQAMQQAKAAAQPGAPNFTPDFLKQFDAAATDATANLDPDVKPYAMERIGLLRDTMGEQALQFESSAATAKRQQDLHGTINTLANTVRSDPTQFGQAVGEGMAAVAASGTEPTLRKEAELEVKGTLASSTVEGMIDANPAHAVTSLNNGEWDAFLTPTAKNALLERATALQDRNARQGQAQFQASTKVMVENEFSSLEATGQGTGLLKPAQVTAAFGDQAPAIFKQMDLARTGYNARAAVALTGPDEDAATIAKFKPNAPDMAAGVSFKEQAGEQSSIEKTIQDKYTAFNRDPAAYVQSASPALNQAFQDAAKDPTKMPAAIALSDQLQAKIAGAKPGDDFAPSVLSTAQATDIAGKIASVPVDQAGPALAQLQTQYGDAWPRVWAELQGKGKLPAAYQVLGTIDDPTTRTALATALRTKPAELDANAGTENVKAVKTAVATALAPFYRTLSVVPNGDSQIAAYRNSAEVLATHYVAQGMDPDSAADKATQGIVDSRYDIAGGPGFNARAPKDTLPLVQAYATRTLDGLSAGDVKAPSAGTLDPQTAATVYFQDHVQTGGQWVSQGDDRWLLLDSARKPVLLKSGQPVSFLIKDALSAPQGPSERDANGVRHGGKVPIAQWLFGQ